MRYAIATTQYEQPCVQLCDGPTPFPEGAVWPVTLELPGYDMVIDAGVLREKTAEEKQAYVDAKAAAEVSAEAARQLAKPLVLKTAENNFLAMCDALTGGTSHTKLGFADLNAIISAIPDPGVMGLTAIRLLAVDAEAKREGGLKWWDDCTWHADIL